MNKILVILTALLLSGCAAKVSQLQTPEKIEYNGKTYKLTASQDLDTIARYVYLAEPDTLEIGNLKLKCCLIVIYPVLLSNA